MKIGEAHRTQSSSLYSANTIGAPMHPAPIGVADRTGKKNHWRTVPGQHCLLVRGTSARHYYWRTNPPCANSISTLKKYTLQSNRSARLSRQSSELGPPNPLNCRWVCPPFGTRGGRSCLQERGRVWSQYEGTNTVVYHVTSFTSPIGGPNISVRLAYFHPNRLLTGL